MLQLADLGALSDGAEFLHVDPGTHVTIANLTLTRGAHLVIGANARLTVDRIHFGTQTIKERRGNTVFLDYGASLQVGSKVTLPMDNLSSRRRSVFSAGSFQVLGDYNYSVSFSFSTFTIFTKRRVAL